MRALLIACAFAACSKATPAEQQVGSAAPPVSDARVVETPAPISVPLGPEGLPTLCADWKAAIDKLATCTALPQHVRDSLTAVYAQASASWGTLPAQAKASLAAICKAGADSVANGAKATCNW